MQVFSVAFSTDTVFSNVYPFSNYFHFRWLSLFGINRSMA